VYISISAQEQTFCETLSLLCKTSNLTFVVSIPCAYNLCSPSVRNERRYFNEIIYLWFARYPQSNNKGAVPNLYRHVTSLYTHVINFTRTHVLQIENSEDITLVSKKITIKKCNHYKIILGLFREFLYKMMMNG
jgi:hypothetical protein